MLTELLIVQDWLEKYPGAINSFNASPSIESPNQFHVRHAVYIGEMDTNLASPSLAFIKKVEAVPKSVIRIRQDISIQKIPESDLTQLRNLTQQLCGLLNSADFQKYFFGGKCSYPDPDVWFWIYNKELRVEPEDG